MKDVLTTGDVAKICRVSSRTAAKWIDDGLLAGYRVPGSRFRRVPLAELRRFMVEHGLPTDGLDGADSAVGLRTNEQT